MRGRALHRSQEGTPAGRQRVVQQPSLLKLQQQRLLVGAKTPLRQVQRHGLLQGSRVFHFSP